MLTTSTGVGVGAVVERDPEGVAKRGLDNVDFAILMLVNRG